MSAKEIFAQAMEHVPALLLVWSIIFGAYWLLGIIKWPRSRWRDRMVDRFGSMSLGEGRSRLVTLALISLVVLFLELLLIRWIAAEIRIFAYFKSLVLIACFLGFGLGCYLTRKPMRLAYTLVPLVAMVFLIELPWEPVRRLVVNLSGFIGWFSDVHVWSRAYFSGNFLWGVA